MKNIIIVLLLLPFASQGQSLFDQYSRPGKVITGNYTVSLFDVFLVVNTTSQNDTLSLPLCSTTYDAVNQRGLIYHIKNIGTNYVYLKLNSGDSLEGSPNLFLVSPGNTSKEIQACNTKNFFIH